MKTAIILFNLGGPDNEESIKPFLFNLFNDKYIISLPQPFRFLLAKLISNKREKTAKEIYREIGSKSPILEITQNQADELEKELSYDGDYKTFIAMRYSKPFAKDAVQKMKEYNPDQVILLPLYPQFSTATSESSIKDFIAAMKKSDLDDLVKSLKIICCYPEDDDFIMSHATLLKQKIVESSLKYDEFRILFSAHGLPQKIVDSGDPYVFQVEKTAKKTLEKLKELLIQEKFFSSDEAEKIDSQVCYQSKVGPLKWTTPSLDSEIKRAAVDNKNPVIVPIAFVSDHSETLVELDIEYKEMADEMKIEKYIRVPALNIEGNFIKSLAKICKNVTKNQEEGFFVGDEAIRICPKTYKRCLNNRQFELA